MEAFDGGSDGSDWMTESERRDAMEAVAPPREGGAEVVAGRVRSERRRKSEGSRRRGRDEFRHSCSEERRGSGRGRCYTHADDHAFGSGTKKKDANGFAVPSAEERRYGCFLW